MLTAVVGINWGDEGKGRMVDLLSERYDIVCRYQGGNNAGHTVVNERGKFILNLLPSGILRDETTNVMGPGMVIDVEHLFHEVERLRAGAEDYIVKPFEILELLVRVEKVLERTGKQKDEIEVGDVLIQLSKHQVRKNGEIVKLKPLEYDLLVLLAKNKNVAFTRDQLLNQVWGSDYLGETRTIDVHIGQLRKKLGLSDVIKTIPKIGYRLED